MDLYTYYRSTSSYRVRIALALKGLDYQALPVNLIAPPGGEHRQAAYLAINPQGRVPALRTDEGAVLTDNAAITAYVEARWPDPPLLGRTAVEKAEIASWNWRVEFEGYTAIAEAFRNSTPAMVKLMRPPSRRGSSATKKKCPVVTQ